MRAFASYFMLSLLFTPAAFAASTTDLTVKGSITPSACTINMPGGDTIDYGKMSAKTLNAEQFTALPQQFIRLSVRCEGLTFFTLNTLDNRLGTSASHTNWHGLGMTPDGEKIGGSGFGLYAPVADGVAARTINSQDGGVTWQPSTLLTHTLLTAVSMGSESVPIAVREFDAELRLYTHIAPTNDLTLLDDVLVDGHATVQLNYL